MKQSGTSMARRYTGAPKARHQIILLASIIGLTSFPSPSAFAEEAQEGGSKELTIEEFLQSLSTVQGVVQRRDPFGEITPPFETSSADDANPNLSSPVLQRYPITDYEVVAVLLGDKYPRALMRLPKEGSSPAQKVVIVKESDKLGNRKGVIAKITLEGIIVQQASRSKHGFVDKTEVLLKVGGKAEDQKRALVAAKQAEQMESDKRGTDN